MGGDGGPAARLDARITSSERYEQLRRVGLHALPHYAIYRTRDDRWLSVGIVDEGKFWRRMCEAAGVAPLAALPMPMRFAAGQPLRRIFASIFARHDLDEWMRRLDPTEVPVVEVKPVTELMKDPQMAHRFAHHTPGGGPIPLGPTARLEAPGLDAHRDEVLRAWKA